MEIEKKTKLLVQINQNTAYCCDLVDLDKLLKFMADDNVFELSKDSNGKWKRVNRLTDDYSIIATTIEDSTFTRLAQSDVDDNDL